MYPLPALLVNISEPAFAAVRSALCDNGVSIDAEFATIDAVFEKWPCPPDSTRRLMVVRLRSLEDTTQLGRLESRFPGWPVMALVEGDCDVSGLYRVSRAGAAQLLPLLFTREEFDAALDRILVQFGTRTTACKVLAVSGVVEGCGATSLAVGMAAELAALGNVPCLITELSFGLGRIAGLLNVAPATTTRDLLSGRGDLDMETVRAAVVPAGEHLSVLAGQHQTLEPFQPPAGKITQLLRLLRHVSTFIVVDMPYTFDPYYFEAASSADRVLLVARQDVPAVQAAKLIIQSLAERGSKTVSLVLNRYDSDRADFTPEKLAGLLGLENVYPVVEDDSGFRAAANAGRPIREVVPSSAAVRDLRRVADALLVAEGITPVDIRPTVWDRAKTFFTHLTG